MTRTRLGPLWHDHLALLTIALSILLGLLRVFLFDRLDPTHCDALLTRGSWLDDAHRNWQPEGCMLHSYKAADASRCLASRRVVFVGDSVTRTLYFQFVHIVDPKLPTAPPQDDRKHTDFSLAADSNVTLDFIWDPFLNTSSTLALINPRDHYVGSSSPQLPALLVVGSGLWYLRYADTSGGLPAWEAMVNEHITAISAGPVKPADTTVFLPVEDVVASKLSPERYNTMRSPDIDAMNSDLYHRIRPSYTGSLLQFSETTEVAPVSFPLVFNQMLDDSQTEDGLHFSDSMIKTQANILLNLRCNNEWPKIPPMDKTCCRGYPWPSAMQFIVLIVIAVWTSISVRLWLQSLCKGGTNSKDHLALAVFGATVCIIYLADRTGLWLKEQKEFSSLAFACLVLSSICIGLLTLHRGDKDLGFLNRDQSDEWKGWMQIAILIYHYFGASKISGIYNPIRVLVAAYLFMTGYGHTTFYLKKADFSFLRIAQVMVRLNLLTLALVYSMNTDYLSYYFTPLVSMWFMVIYATMAIGSQLNHNTPFLVCKILSSMAMFAIFMLQNWPLESLFTVLKQLCNIDWSVREWTFRVTLDQYIVYWGMLTAVAVAKIREYHLTDHPLWPTLVKIACGCSVLILLWFTGFELAQESKFTYNSWHPYISFLPITAFVILRNATPILRSSSSRAFAFIGKCSLETFIIQFHFWLAGDTKGVLLVIPGTRWRALNFVLTSFVFIYVSHQVAWASGEITSLICNQREKTLPTSNRDVPGHGPSEQTASGCAEAVRLVGPGEDRSSSREDRPETETPAHSQHWLKNLTRARYQSTIIGAWDCSQVEVKVRIGLAAMFMWIANMLWANY
ncbi:10 TM acyl transferase domain found in Cas1p-domain-containing protein [Pisolithus croceorrhizus]|nr:10 TM acyl transferase domain found in Cas1p-domain-containing protein [Pisolithus croceorrhizus]